MKSKTSMSERCVTSSCGRPKGFTLVELLVVIAIISVLAAMLLPALEEARLSAQKISCVNNTRQTAVGMASYAGDFKGFWPWRSDGVAKGHVYTVFQWNDPGVFDSHETLEEYIPPGQTYVCPVHGSGDWRDAWPVASGWWAGKYVWSYASYVCYSSANRNYYKPTDGGAVAVANTQWRDVMPVRMSTSSLRSPLVCDRITFVGSSGEYITNHFLGSNPTFEGFDASACWPDGSATLEKENYLLVLDYNNDQYWPFK